jgi:hypothetical protein
MKFILKHLTNIKCNVLKLKEFYRTIVESNKRELKLLLNSDHLPKTTTVLGTHFQCF